MEVRYVLAVSLCFVNLYLSSVSYAAVKTKVTTPTVKNVVNSGGCTAVKLAWGEQRFGPQLVPTTMITGSHLNVCTASTAGTTCCSQQMEEKLISRSRQDFDRVIGEQLGHTKLNFQTRAAKFKAFCTELITNSSKDLHEMFTKTYGVLYQQNARVFADLFRDLHSFYRGSNLNLHEVLDGFFATLLQRMFVLLNAHYTFNDEYIQCIGRSADGMHPFEDVPQKLAVHLKRAFIAARTFLQSLVVGSDVITAVMKIEPSSSCSKAITRMNYCSYCGGLVNTKPCRVYCLNVMKACLAYQAELSETWNIYLEATLKVAERLEGSFSIKSVLDPIDVKISDAIMNFQENSEAITSKIFQSCGQPTLGGRSKRHTSDSEISRREDDTGIQSSDVRFRRSSETSSRREHKYVRPTVSSVTTPFDRVLQEAREVLTNSKDFWISLPLSTCNMMTSQNTSSISSSSSSKPKGEGPCWTGLGRGRYSKPLVGDGLLNQTENPEVDFDVRQTNVIVNRQILRLKLITSKLRNAYSGLDVDSIHSASPGDDEDYDDDSSGDDNDQHSGSNGNDEDFRPSSDIDTEDDFQMFTPPRLAPTHRPIEFITKRPVATVPTVQGRPTMRSWYSSDSSGGTTAFTLASASRLLTLLSVVAVTLPSPSLYRLSTAGASFFIAVLLIFLS